MTGCILPEIVIKNAAVDSRTVNIEIAGGLITGVGSSAERGSVCTLDAHGLTVTAGKPFVCRAGTIPDGEELLFSGYSTLIYEHDAASPPASSLIKSAMRTLLNFAVISACKRRDTLFDDGTLTPCGAEGLAVYTGALETGMIADIFFWDSHFRAAKMIKGGRLIFDRTVSPRRDIIYAMAEPERSVFFTTSTAASGYVGQKMRGERRVIAVE